MKCYDASIKLDGDHFREPPHYTVMSPSADFSASPQTGQSPLEVSFTDESSGCTTAWGWSFDNGDGNTINIYGKDPTYTFETSGVYDVELTIYEYGKSVTIIKYGFITVSEE